MHPHPHPHPQQLQHFCVLVCVCAIHLFLLFVASSWQSVYAQVIPECAAADLRLQELQA